MQINKEQPFFDALIGKKVSNVWRGYGSAIFLEFGELSHSVNKQGMSHSVGELTLMIEWSWRIEGPGSILGGSWSDESLWLEMFEGLKNSTVSDVHLFGRLPEICISLSNDLNIVSFMTAEGQPEWAIISREPIIGTLAVKKGALTVEL
jgi:hypothetical protein